MPALMCGRDVIGLAGLTTLGVLYSLYSIYMYVFIYIYNVYIYIYRDLEHATKSINTKHVQTVTVYGAFNSFDLTHLWCPRSSCK